MLLVTHLFHTFSTQPVNSLSINTPSQFTLLTHAIIHNVSTPLSPLFLSPPLRQRCRAGGGRAMPSWNALMREGKLQQLLLRRLPLPPLRRQGGKARGGNRKEGLLLPRLDQVVCSAFYSLSTHHTVNTPCQHTTLSMQLSIHLSTTCQHTLSTHFINTSHLVMEG